MEKGLYITLYSRRRGGGGRRLIKTARGEVNDFTKTQQVKNGKLGWNSRPCTQYIDKCTQYTLVSLH